jgi:hypothetical protein
MLVSGLVSGNNDLAYHHAEIARLTEAIAASRPNSSRANALRTKLRYHEDHIGRPKANGGQREQSDTARADR